jgi:large subunit ribosomal protein L9
MDVILIKDVEKLGTEGAVIHVKTGFARNYLMPQGLAVEATPARMKAAEAALKRRQAQAQQAQADAEALKRKLESRTVKMTLNVGEDGQPFGSVTAHDLAEALARDGFPVEKHQIQLETPLKTLGAADVPVRLHAEVTAALKVLIAKA